MLLKAKTEAETKGYIFETSHDVIVAKAKKEGKLVVFSSHPGRGGRFPEKIPVHRRKGD